MSTILDLSDVAAGSGQPRTKWRDDLLPATFRNQQFHVESSSIQGGRHIVEHEFPKRDIPYGEDMGRRPFEFSIRGYCIAFPYDSNQTLYQRDYRVPRDNLKTVLDDNQPGVLQLPTMLPIYVVCTRYNLTEEQRVGGYCVFDMSFVEYGIKPTSRTGSTIQNVTTASQSLKARVQAVLGQNPSLNAPLPPPVPPTIGPNPPLLLGAPNGSQGRTGSQSDRARRAPQSRANLPAARPSRI
jgi:prophage DNA circulation protein